MGGGNCHSGNAIYRFGEIAIENASDWMVGKICAIIYKGIKTDQEGGDQMWQSMAFVIHFR